MADPAGANEQIYKMRREPPDERIDPADPIKIVGNLFSVGTHDLSVFLIATDAGHILVNTGVQGSTPTIRANIEALGFNLEDVAVLLTMQSHWDHTGTLAEIKRITGARMLASHADVRILEDGGYSDPHFGGIAMFEPVQVDERLDHGDIIDLGGTSLRFEDHPGHTEGSASYSMTVEEAERSYSVVIANMGTVNANKRLVREPTYRGVADDFEKTFHRQKELDVDIWVAAHAGHYGLHDKYEPAAGYSPEAFVDAGGYLAAVERYEQEFRRLVAAEIELS